MWRRADLAAAVFAVAPQRLGGLWLRAGAGPVRDKWLALLGGYLEEDVPQRKIPAGIGLDRLLGGLDLASSLSAGKPILQRGLLAEIDKGVGLLMMAESASETVVGSVLAALDSGTVRLERDGFSARLPARFGLVCLDEGEEEQQLAAALSDRMAMLIDLHQVSVRDVQQALFSRSELRAARSLLSGVRLEKDALRTLSEAAVQLGIASLRLSIAAARVAQICAALDRREEVQQLDLEAAAQLVLAPHGQWESIEPEAPPPPPDKGDEATSEKQQESDALADMVVEAARANLPQDALEGLVARSSRTSKAPSGRSQYAKGERGRGRVVGERQTPPSRQARPHLLGTLRAAAPWQPLRKVLVPERNVVVLPQDFRYVRRKHRSVRTIIFSVDASGSAAVARLAEAKGAVELLLGECYVRRDLVAVSAFRGGDSEILLPPTRSLTRAKRSLADLPGGGGTPLAAGIDSARMLALSARQRGQDPLVVMLTDGRANICLDGRPGREEANAQAGQSARAFQSEGFASLLVDTSTRPSNRVQELAENMGARYMPLPRSGAVGLSAAVLREVE